MILLCSFASLDNASKNSRKVMFSKLLFLPVKKEPIQFIILAKHCITQSLSQTFIMPPPLRRSGGAIMEASNKKNTLTTSTSTKLLATSPIWKSYRTERKTSNSRSKLGAPLCLSMNAMHLPLLLPKR